jgi:hypothetical protein
MQSQKPKWVWFSTHETIENEVPSVTAILETVIAVPLYWWIALKVGIFWPLLISAAVAPLVLLRSERSVKLGTVLVRQFELPMSIIEIDLNKASGSWPDLFIITSIFSAMSTISLKIFGTNLYNFSIISMILHYYIAVIASILLCLLLNVINSKYIKVIPNSLSHYLDRSYDMAVSFLWTPLHPPFITVTMVIIRFYASAINIKSTISTLPKNFRRVSLCTSPIHIPEIDPGLDKTNSLYAFHNYFWNSLPKKDILASFGTFSWALLLFLPAWLYRLTIKSTAWFWWPLAFLGGDLRRAKNPKLFRWKVWGSLWAKASLIGAALSILAFVVVNAARPAVLTENPLITPIGYLLLVDWSRPWQVFAVAGAALSIFIVLLVDDVHGEYEIGLVQENRALQKAAERKFGWIERLARLRLLVFILFWLIVGAHALLYFNSRQCWFALSPALQGWAETVYGDRLPRPCQCMVWRFFGLEPLERLSANGL